MLPVQSKRWWKPLLAFLITFGVLAMAASVVRVIAVYQHFYALGMQTDDPAVAAPALTRALVAAGFTCRCFCSWRRRYPRLWRE